MKYKLKKNIGFIIIFSIYLFCISLIFSEVCYAADPTLVTKLNKAFEKIKNYILKLATPIAPVA